MKNFKKMVSVFIVGALLVSNIALLESSLVDNTEDSIMGMATTNYDPDPGQH